jgi:glucokinase
MILAGDIGGTKTLLGVFEPAPARPRPVLVRSFITLEFSDLSSMILRFMADCGSLAGPIDRASFGVAGPVVGETARLTNVPWLIDARGIAAQFHFGHVGLLNDLQATAYAVPVLEGSELLTLQQGVRAEHGTIAIVAAGTGLGEASLCWFDEHYVPIPSEGGHADFAPRTEREIALLRELTARYGRASVEHVVSGPGMLNVHRLTHRGPCSAGIDVTERDAPIAMSQAAIDRRCSDCAEALSIFVEAYGAEAGNLALRSVSTGGVYVAGGVARGILPAITSGAFIRAFRDKPPLNDLVGAMPVHVVLNPETALLGAAVHVQ